MSLEISVGTQAGIFESRVIASYIIELLKKCHEIRDLYGALAEELKQGRESLNEHEQTIDNMQITVQAFSETMDKIGVRMLQENIAVSQRHTQIDALKRDIGMYLILKC
jgi:predicted  nucleic acid-binding Zn-ribbon protein